MAAAGVTPSREMDFRVLWIGDVDPPPLPMREQMDDEKLGELAASIRDKGVLSPIGVYEQAGRFVIIYGHRRYVASQLAGEVTIPARVHSDGQAREEDFKFTENYHREEVNPGEEAVWLADLLERKHEGRIEDLCRELGLTESFVNGRLDLLRGDDGVLAALKKQQINLSVARELNKFRDAGWRAHYLADAIEVGANATTVRAWRMNCDRFIKQQEIAAANPGGVPASTEVPIGSADRCLLCNSATDVHEMEYVRVHRSCLTVLERDQRERAATPRT